MQINSNPFFRKNLVPWYDSDAVCGLIFLLMLLILIFGLIGIRVAWQSPVFHPHVWIPLLVTALSAGVGISTIIRLVRRHFKKLPM